MIERVAKEVFKAMIFGRETECPEWVEGGNSFAQNAARKAARAAIEAMCEPTDEMCHAFNDAFPIPEGETLLRDIAPLVFNAMIDAALDDKRPINPDVAMGKAMDAVDAEIEANCSRGSDNE